MGSQADWLSQIIGLFSQPCVTLSRLTDAFLPILGVSYSKANNLRLPLAKPGRKGILQIQKVNSTYSFPNLVNNVYAFTTTRSVCIQQFYCYLTCYPILIYLLSNFSSARLEYCIWIHIQLVIRNPTVIYYFFYPSTVAYPQRALLYPDWASSSSCLGLPFGSTRYP